MADLAKQDRTGTRTFNGLKQEYKFKETQEKVKKILSEQTDADKKIASLISLVENLSKDLDNLSDNVIKKEEGKGLSTNDYTDKDKEALTDVVTKTHTHQNKQILDKITQDIIDVVKYNLNDYKTNVVTNLIGKCIVKNNRAVMNVTIEADIVAETPTTLFENLPFTNHIDFQLINGVCTLNQGTCSVLVNEDISNLILNLVFDIENEEEEI